MDWKKPLPCCLSTQTLEKGIFIIASDFREGKKLTNSYSCSIVNSVFLNLQRAMDLYKRQMMETRGKPFITGRTLELISASSLENRGEQVHCDVARVEDPVLDSAADMLDAPISDRDSENVEAVPSAAEDKSAEPVRSPSKDVRSPISPPHYEDNDQNNMVVGPEPNVSGGELGAMSCEQQELVKSTETGVVGFSSPEIASRTVTTQSSLGDNFNEIGNSNANGDESSLRTEAFGDATNGPLCIPDGSPKVCEALMSGSKESESIILSRIHHSPESTH